MWAMVWVRTTQEGVVGRDSTRSSTRVESTTVLRSVPPWMEHGRGSLDTNAHDPRFHPAIQISIPRRNRHPAPNDYLMFDNFWMDLCIFKRGFEWIFAFKKKVLNGFVHFWKRVLNGSIHLLTIVDQKLRKNIWMIWMNRGRMSLLTNVSNIGWMGAEAYLHTKISSGYERWRRTQLHKYKYTNTNSQIQIHK